MSRYQRIIELGWSRTVLQQAKVMVVGAGALGNEVLKNLALLGVGHILVVDMDKIEDHNLTRTVLFRPQDIGKYKSIVAAERVRHIDDSVKVYPFTDLVQNTFGLGVFQEVDVVFGCLDNIQARIDVNRYCYKTGTLYIDAGLRKLDGDVKVFANPYEVCLDCTLTQSLRDEAWARFSCLKLRTDRDFDGVTLPTSPTISSIMAGFQVQIAMKYLHGAAIPTNHRISVMGNIDEVSKSKMHFNKHCPTHFLYECLPDEVIPLLHDSNQMTVRELVNVIQKDWGNGAAIALDYDLITHATCPHHQYRKPLYKRRGTVFFDEMICPECIAEGKTQLEALMREYFINQIDGSEQNGLLDKTLSEIGTPLYQIFTAKVLQEEELTYRYYAIAGDRAQVFGHS